MSQIQPQELPGVRSPRYLFLKNPQHPKATSDQRVPEPPVHNIGYPQEVTVQARVFTVSMGRNVAGKNVALI